ncbi:MAG: hypothetical protein FK731_09385 [Asgard group archaeon]|nr:hypothetical protein [Asgard group archaeon]
MSDVPFQTELFQITPNNQYINLDILEARLFTYGGYTGWEWVFQNQIADNKITIKSTHVNDVPDMVNWYDQGCFFLRITGKNFELDANGNPNDQLAILFSIKKENPAIIPIEIFNGIYEIVHDEEIDGEENILIVTDAVNSNIDIFVRPKGAGKFLSFRKVVVYLV